MLLSGSDPPVKQGEGEGKGEGMGMGEIEGVHRLRLFQAAIQRSVVHEMAEARTKTRASNCVFDHACVTIFLPLFNHFGTLWNIV